MKKYIEKSKLNKYKKGGKLSQDYIKEARKKPGGSNVGKYNMNQTFAGPSGGAPQGSYPIGDIHHAMSALRLAHNAPNPSGIKAAVYRKYPQLKDIGGKMPNQQEYINKGRKYSTNATLPMFKQSGG